MFSNMEDAFQFIEGSRLIGHICEESLVFVCSRSSRIPEGASIYGLYLGGVGRLRFYGFTNLTEHVETRSAQAQQDWASLTDGLERLPADSDPKFLAGRSRPTLK